MKSSPTIQSKGLSIESFLQEAMGQVLVDVRSPGEYRQGHLPGAVNVPLFDDHERAEIGTLYKIKGKEEAVLRGIEIVSPKLADFIRAVKEKDPLDSKVYVYCYRGGMRSGSFCWLMETAGLKAKRLEGGYKSYRALAFSIFKERLSILLIGGPTGSGKTDVLKEIAMQQQVADLEGLASHKGSAFGFIGEKAQPAQQQFENNLYEVLASFHKEQPIFMEDESFTIGNIRLPYDLWLQMKQAPIIKLEIPFDLRVKRLVKDYGQVSIETLRRPLLAIQTRLGPQHCKTALEHLEKGELDKVAEITLHYYDKAYEHSHLKRGYKNIFKLDSFTDDPATNAQLILNFAQAEGLLKKTAHG